MQDSREPKAYTAVTVNFRKNSIMYTGVKEIWNDGTILYLECEERRHLIPLKEIESVVAKK